MPNKAVYDLFDLVTFLVENFNNVAEALFRTVALNLVMPRNRFLEGHVSVCHFPSPFVNETARRPVSVRCRNGKPLGEQVRIIIPRRNSRRIVGP